MNRRVNALVVVLGMAVMVAACGSGAPMTASVTQVPASHLATLEPSPTAPPAATSAAPTQTPPSPSPQAPESPSPSPLPETIYVPFPQPSVALLAAGAPAMPAGARLDYLADQCNSPNQDEGCEWLRVSWREANPSGVTIRVYAVRWCLHTPTASKPNAKCVVDGDTIPKASLLLLGTAPAYASSFSFVLANGETMALGWLPGRGPDVDAVVLQAVNSHGGSPFAIAASSGSCLGCTL